MCGDFVLKDKTKDDKRGQSICPKCQIYFALCPTCGGWSNSIAKGKCSQCATPARLDEGVGAPSSTYNYIHDYGHKPSPIFLHMPVEAGQEVRLYEGVELETDLYPSDGYLTQASSALHLLSEDSRLFYQKQDGSLRNGIEIVTHPATLQYHRTSMPWKEIQRVVVKNKGRSHETHSCGMHIHFNTSFLMPEKDVNILKVVFLVENFWSEIVRFSRRNYNDLARWANKTYANIVPDKEHSAKYGQMRGAARRHSAVNLCPANTVELRVFKGSLNPETILASIELVDHMVRFVKDCNKEDLLKLQWEDFVKAINPDTYPELMSYLRRRKLCA